MTTVDFGSLFHFIRNGMNVKQDKSGEGLPITRIETISDAVVDPSRVGYAGLTDADARSWLLEDGDILFSHINSVSHIGKCAVYRGRPSKLVHGMNLLCLRSDQSKLSPEFAKYLLRSSQFRSRLSSCIKKAVNQASVSIGDLQAIPVTIPPLREQRRIAEILDKADALRAKRRAALAKLDMLAQSIFLDMFGDPATNPKAWPVRALEEVFEIARGGSPRPIDDYITESPDGVNWIMIGDASEGAKYITGTRKKIKPQGVKRSRTVKPGDFLLTNSMSFGRPYIMRTSGCVHDGWLVLSPRSEEVVPDYFYSLLGSRSMYAEFTRRAPGATVKNLNIDLVKSVVVPVPPRESQQEYARRVLAIERAAAPLQRSRDTLECLYAALQYRAFQGYL